MPIENAYMLKDRYKLGGELGSGGFGIVKKAFDSKLKTEVAIKIESRYSHETLQHEKEIYRSLEKRRGFPIIHDYFEAGDSRYMTMTLLGDSLETKLRKCNRCMNLKTTLLIADQLLDRLYDLHKSCYIHRDIKPENLMMGLGLCQKTLFMIDLGIAKRFKYNNHHLDGSEHDKVIGTARYASINNHEGEALSRRDDLESMAYVLIYLQKGTLPWQGLKCSDSYERSHMIYKIKRKTTPEKLCEGLEPEFLEFLKYARNLGYTDKPDYKKIKKLFHDLFMRKKFKMDHVYQWDETKPKPIVIKPSKNNCVKKRKRKNNIKPMAEKEPFLPPQNKKQKTEDELRCHKEQQEKLLAIAKSQAAEEKKMKKMNQKELTALAVQQANFEKFIKTTITSYQNFKPILI